MISHESSPGKETERGGREIYFLNRSFIQLPDHVWQHGIHFAPRRKIEQLQKIPKSPGQFG